MPKKNAAETPDKKQNYATAKQIAAVLKVNEYEVKTFIKKGMPKVAANKFNLIECVHWYLDYQKYWRDRRTITEIADMLGITERWLNRLVVEKGIPKEARGVYLLSQTILAYINFLKEQIKNAADGESSLTDERKRLLRMQANRVGMDLLEKQKQLVPVTLMEKVFLEFTVLYGKKLDALPGTILNKLFACKTKEEMLHILQNQIHKTKTELSTVKN